MELLASEPLEMGPLAFALRTHSLVQLASALQHAAAARAALEPSVLAPQATM
jgi:hypothetical protein